MIPELPYDHIAVEGIIGSGKTTLAKLIAQRWNTRLVLEEFDDNPFLPKFYAEPEKFAFPLELSFLAERYSQKKELGAEADLFQPKVVSDYILAKSIIFARHNLTVDEFELFSKLFSIINQRVPKPDLLVFLHCSPQHAISNIRKRGRVYEQGISDVYLHNINAGYLEHFRSLTDVPVVVIPSDQLDFVNSSEDREWLLNSICTGFQVGQTRLSQPTTTTK